MHENFIVQLPLRFVVSFVRRVLGLGEGVMFGIGIDGGNIGLDVGRAGCLPGKCTLIVF